MTLALALSFRELKQNCHLCQRDPKNREAWGCDVPTPNPQAVIVCPSCEGVGCDACAGEFRGKRLYYTCPRRIVDAQTWRFVSAFKWAREGILPNAGGLLDQPATFVDAMGYAEVRWCEFTQRLQQREMERVKKPSKTTLKR